MKINRKQILMTLLELIENISSSDYQERVWVLGIGDEVGDFDETVCDFFQECDGVLKSHKDFGLSDQQYSILLNFRENFESFCRGPALVYQIPQNFIGTSEWNFIMSEAKITLKAFDIKNKSINKHRAFIQLICFRHR